MKSSLIIFGIYSTILSALLCVFNNLSGQVSWEKWEFLLLNPFNEDERFILNCILVSLILSGAMSMILFKARTWCRCCEKIVEKAYPGQVKNHIHIDLALSNYHGD